MFLEYQNGAILPVIDLYAWNNFQEAIILKFSTLLSRLCKIAAENEAVYLLSFNGILVEVEVAKAFILSLLG